MVSMDSAALQYQLDHSFQSRQPNILAAGIILLVIAYAAVVFRCYARYRSHAKFGVDDLLVLLALIPTTAFATGLFLSLRYGMGKHTVLVSDERGFAITYIIDVVWFAIGTALTKASILCFYCRIFHGKMLARLCYILDVFIAAYNLALILVVIVGCVPFYSLEDTDETGRCYNSKAGIVVLGCVNILTDFAILSIPIRYVTGLQMDRFRKVQVCGAFLTGAIVCIFGIIRVVSFATAEKGDPAFNLTFSAIWTFCEMCIGILAACLPTMGLLVTEVRSSFMVSSMHDYVSEKWKSRLRSVGSSPLRPTFSGDGALATQFGAGMEPLQMPEPPEMAQSRGLLNIDIPDFRLFHSSSNLGSIAPSIRSLESEEAARSQLLLNVDIPSPQFHRHSASSGNSAPWATNYDWDRW